MIQRPYTCMVCNLQSWKYFQFISIKVAYGRCILSERIYTHFLPITGVCRCAMGGSHLWLNQPYTILDLTCRLSFLLIGGVMALRSLCHKQNHLSIHSISLEAPLFCSRYLFPVTKCCCTKARGIFLCPEVMKRNRIGRWLLKSISCTVLFTIRTLMLVEAPPSNSFPARILYDYHVK